MSIYGDIFDFHSDNIFTNTEMFAETITLAPAGDWDNTSTPKVVAIRDHLQGSNEVRGDGVKMERVYGRTTRESIIIEFDLSTILQNPVDRENPDMVKLDNRIYCAVRRIGADSAMQAYLFVNVTDGLTHRQTLRG